MKRMKWRGLALGLVTSTLGLGIAACDDDTTNNAPDLSMSMDMSATVDMTMTGSPGTAQIVLADVVGTVFTPTQTAPRTHALIGIASFPKAAPTTDPTSDLSLTPPSGC